MTVGALEPTTSGGPLAEQIARIAFGRSGDAILRRLARDLDTGRDADLLLFDLRAELEEALDCALLRDHLARTPARATRHPARAV
jgi:hypothetical protein